MSAAIFHRVRVNALSCGALLAMLLSCVDASAAIRLSSVANPSNVAAGQRVNYAVTVSNTAASAQTAHLKATVPTNTTVSKNELSLAASCDGAVNWSTCAAGQTLTFAAFNIATGASVTVVYPALVSTTAPPSNGKSLTSTAIATIGTTTLQATASATFASDAVSTAHLTVSALPAQALAGETVTYTLTYGNPGSAGVAATLDFPLPAGTTFVSASDGGKDSAGTVSWPLGTLAAGTAARRTLVLKVASTAAAGSQLAVDAALRNPTTQGVLVHAGLTTPVGNATVTVLNVRAVATPDPVAPGQRVSFALTVSNTAASSHTAHVMATVPTNTTVSKNELSLAASCDGAVNWSTCAAGQTLTFAAFNIATGASVTVVYPALVSTTAPPSNGTLLNSAVWVNDYYVGNDYQLNVAAIAASAKSVAGYPVDELPAQESAGGIVSSAKKAVAVAADHKKTRVASSAVALLPPTSSERPGTQGAAGAAIVPASPDTRVIVPLDHALIEDGSRTAYIDEGWPEFLAERLRTEYEPARRVVICPTVSETGSPPQSELADALSRSARGAETQESVGARTVGARTQGSVKYVILLERIADSSGSDAQSVEPIAQQIIARDLQLIAQAHALGLKIFGATITPFEGTTYPNHTALDEANREALNAWIRGGRAYDAIIDFDLATSDPKHPTRLLPAYDSGDHFHLNDLGYEAMADAVDLSLFDE